jgi:hypothetical protein
MASFVRNNYLLFIQDVSKIRVLIVTRSRACEMKCFVGK